MDYHDQGEVEGFSPAYASSQSHSSDTKVHENHSVSQLSAPGVGKKVSFSLAVRPEPDDELPDYSGRAKAEKDAKTAPIRSRSAVSHSKTSKSIKKAQGVKQSSTKPLRQIVSHPLVLKAKKPTAKKPYDFWVRIKLDEELEEELSAGVYNPSKPYLTEPIATGDWFGVDCTIEAAVEDDEPQSLGSWVKITWGEFLNDLYAKTPTGSFQDLGPKEKDPFPGQSWYYYDVDVFLLRGAKVE